MPVTVDIPLPRSLTRYARSFGCGERAMLTDGASGDRGGEREEEGSGVAGFP